MRRILFLVLISVLLPAAAPATQPQAFSIGYLELAGDARYAEVRNYTGLRLKTAHRPYAGAQVALRESRITGRALGLKLGLERTQAADVSGMVADVRRMRADAGVRFFLVDARSDDLLALADAVRDEGVLLFNISETDDRLRQEDCRANVMHVIPSRSMLTDAMAQYLAYRDWRRVLVLRGQQPEDALTAEAFERSARKFGLKIVALKNFELSNDPRNRAQNNVALMTAEPDYDVLYLADSYGEFGRYVPYQTKLPRPVVGSEGLEASAWHWSWERHGGPQLNQRFDRQAKREMRDADWAAWAAYKAVVEAATRTHGTDFDKLVAYLKGGQLTLDTYKGNPASFRSWNNQLRQPILLHTYDAVTARAPLDGFLHRRDVLDTLGIDQPESKCRK